MILVTKTSDATCARCHPIYCGRLTCGRRGNIGGRSHRRTLPPSYCGACLNFYREKDSAIPFPRRPSKSNFVYSRNNRSQFVGHDFFFSCGKIPDCF